MSQGFSKFVPRQVDLVRLGTCVWSDGPGKCLDQMPLDQRLRLPRRGALRISPCWTYITLWAPGYNPGYTRSIHRSSETHQELALHFRCPYSICFKTIEPVISHRCVDASSHLRVRENWNNVVSILFLRKVFLPLLPMHYSVYRSFPKYHNAKSLLCHILHSISKISKISQRVSHVSPGQIYCAAFTVSFSLHYTREK